MRYRPALSGKLRHLVVTFRWILGILWRTSCICVCVRACLSKNKTSVLEEDAPQLLPESRACRKWPRFPRAVHDAAIVERKTVLNLDM